MKFMIVLVFIIAVIAALPADPRNKGNGKEHIVRNHRMVSLLSKDEKNEEDDHLNIGQEFGAVKRVKRQFTRGGLVAVPLYRGNIGAFKVEKIRLCKILYEPENDSEFNFEYIHDYITEHLPEANPEHNKELFDLIEKIAYESTDVISDSFPALPADPLNEENRKEHTARNPGMVSLLSENQNNDQVDHLDIVYGLGAVRRVKRQFTPGEGEVAGVDEPRPSSVCKVVYSWRADLEFNFIYILDYITKHLPEALEHKSELSDLIKKMSFEINK